MGLNLSVKEINLDIQNQGFINTIYVQEGDVDSRQLTISLFDGGADYEVSSSSTVSLQGTRSDGMVVNRYVDSFNKNTITIVFRNEEICTKGISKYKVLIQDGNEELSSFPFKIKVYENVYDSNGVIANPSIDILEDTIKRTNETIDKANEKIKEIDDIITPISTVMKITCVQQYQKAHGRTMCFANQSMWSRFYLKTGRYE